MKNITTAALMAATVLSLAACGDKNKKQTPGDSASTTTVIDSNTKTTTVIDSTKTDTVKVAEQKAPAKKPGDVGNSSSMRAMRDSFKKDSAKMSRK